MKELYTFKYGPAIWLTLYIAVVLYFNRLDEAAAPNQKFGFKLYSVKFVQTFRLYLPWTLCDEKV